MWFVFTQITQFRMHYFKSFNPVKSTRDMKTSFTLGNELKLTQIELFSEMPTSMDYP